ncbi:hypothetical protein KBI33_01355 [Candidatus Shapirobacteria bacterium]|nr:hypothetical protein [Candidatus Shapirobacteria bacterium]
MAKTLLVPSTGPFIHGFLEAMKRGVAPKSKRYRMKGEMMRGFFPEAVKLKPLSNQRVSGIGYCFQSRLVVSRATSIPWLITLFINLKVEGFL